MITSFRCKGKVYLAETQKTDKGVLVMLRADTLKYPMTFYTTHGVTELAYHRFVRNRKGNELIPEESSVLPEVKHRKKKGEDHVSGS